MRGGTLETNSPAPQYLRSSRVLARMSEAPPIYSPPILCSLTWCMVKWGRSDPPRMLYTSFLHFAFLTIVTLSHQGVLWFCTNCPPLLPQSVPGGVDLATCYSWYSTPNPELCLPHISKVYLSLNIPQPLCKQSLLLSNGTPGSSTRDIRPRNDSPTWSSSNSPSLGWRQQKAPSALKSPPIT